MIDHRGINCIDYPRSQQCAFVRDPDRNHVEAVCHGA